MGAGVTNVIILELYYNLENIFLVDKPEPTVCCLHVVKCLPHVTISSENDSLKAFGDIGYLYLVPLQLNYISTKIAAKI